MPGRRMSSQRLWMHIAPVDAPCAEAPAASDTRSWEVTGPGAQSSSADFRKPARDDAGPTDPRWLSPPSLCIMLAKRRGNA